MYCCKNNYDVIGWVFFFYFYSNLDVVFWVEMEKFKFEYNKLMWKCWLYLKLLYGNIWYGLFYEYWSNIIIL